MLESGTLRLDWMPYEGLAALGLATIFISFESSGTRWNRHSFDLHALTNHIW